MSELRLDGKVALITGSGRGLGRAYARLLASRGARIVVNDPGTGIEGGGAGDRAPATQVANEINDAGGSAVANFDSVADAEGAAAMVAQAIDSYGSLDIVINNAGNFMDRHGLAETTTETFSRIWQVHVLGTVNVNRAAWGHLADRGHGRIVNTMSHAGYLGSRNNLEYSAAKGAIHGLTRSLSLEGAELGIAVNAVAPAAVTRPVEWANPKITSVAPPGALDAELAAPAVLWLSHTECQVNGEILGVGSGSTTRMMVAETEGYFSKKPTPEQIRDNFAAIMAEDTRTRSGLRFYDEAETRGADMVKIWANN